MHGNHGLSVVHDPGISIVVERAQHVSRKQVRPVDLADKMGGENVKGPSKVQENLVVGDDGVLPDRPQGRFSAGRESNGRGQNCWLS